MHDGYILALDIINDDLADLGVAAPVPEEQQVAAPEGRFHGFGEDDDDGRWRVGGDREAFPEHERGRED